MSRNAKAIKVQKQLKNITDNLNKKIKEACDNLDNNIYALDKSIWNELEKRNSKKSKYFMRFDFLYNL